MNLIRKRRKVVPHFALQEINDGIKIHRSRMQEKIHVEVVITNGNREIFLELKKVLIKIKHLFPISYVITEVDSPG